MEAKEIFEAVTAKLGDAVSDFQAAVPKDGPRDPFFRVAPEKTLELMQFLRDDPSLRFDFLQNLTAVDWPKQNAIEVVYHLYSYALRHEIAVKTQVPRDNPHVPSVTSLWKIADWYEREQFDLFGVVFDGHPDLKRLLLPEDWIGHPMRKDYTEQKEYRGMSTSRTSPLDLLVIHDKAHKTDVMQ